MECTKCGHINEANSKFCRNCGTELSPIVKGQLEYTPRKITEGQTGGLIIGIIFIALGLFIGIVIFLPLLFNDVIGSIGSFFGGFGETMGEIGSDFGNFMGNWGENFGNAVGNFFSGVTWWNILRVIIPAFFIIPGIIIIIANFRKR
ncbi:MAG: zinc-ribbon domain-containing protein [Candidatus Thorarchaeota archaeon]